MTTTGHKIKLSITTLALGIITSFSLINSPQAHADNLDDVVKGALKLANQENYKLRTSLNGTFNLDKMIEGNYQVILGSQVDNSCGLGCKEANNIALNVILKPADASPIPFETLTLKMKVDMLSYDQAKSLYFKPTELSLSATGLDETDQAEFEEIVTSMETMTSPYMNQWIYVSEESLQTFYENEGVDLSLLATEKLNKDFLEIVKNSDNKTGREILTELIEKGVQSLENDEELTAEEGQMVLEVADTLMEANLFRTYNVVSGNNAGFQRSIMNRFAVVDAVEKMMQGFTEEGLSQNDKAELLAFLNKMSFSFWYRFDESGLMDVFSFYFGIDDLEDMSFNLKYRQQVWGVGQAKVPTAPEETLEIMDVIQEQQAKLATEF